MYIYMYICMDIFTTIDIYIDTSHIYIYVYT